MTPPASGRNPGRRRATRAQKRKARGHAALRRARPARRLPRRSRARRPRRAVNYDSEPDAEPNARRRRPADRLEARARDGRGPQRLGRPARVAPSIAEAAPYRAPSRGAGGRQILARDRGRRDATASSTGSARSARTSVMVATLSAMVVSTVGRPRAAAAAEQRPLERVERAARASGSRTSGGGGDVEAWAVFCFVREHALERVDDRPRARRAVRRGRSSAGTAFQWKRRHVAGPRSRSSPRCGVLDV